MCGFCRITDLRISQFNFSSKTYNSKVYTRYRKVVVLVTQNTTKLDLQFLDLSVILYEFYKVQHFESRSKTDSSRTGPRFSQLGP
jgi:hypothetical protein